MTELKELHGIKEKRLESLKKAGIQTSADLLGFLPVKYLDMTHLAKEDELVDGAEVLVKATVIGAPFNLFYSRVKTTKVKLDTDGKKFFAMWFNQPYMKNNLVENERYIFYGKIKNSNGRITLLSPMFEKEENSSRLFGILPKYQKIDCVPQTLISSAIKEILSLEDIPSVFDDEFFGVKKLKNAYESAHFPTSIEEAKEGLSRIFIEKVVRTMLSYRLSGSQSVRKERKYKSFDLVGKMQELLPFSLTKSQKKAIEEIAEDMRSSNAMNRLLQGDVGSGKTVVVTAACLLAVYSGYSAAVMCPTTTLAAQHFKTFSEVFEKTGIRIRLVTSETKDFDEADIYIGTHSLFAKDARYKNLAFVAIDEQQKFGVSARASLVEKGFSADVLSLTATPIPRTLSLILYGALNISYLDNERQKNNIETFVTGGGKTDKMYKFLDELIENGGLCYIVCRKIDTTEKSEEEGAEEKYKEIKKAFPTRKVALLHGRMKPSERSRTVTDFLNGEIDVLVSTSVIEVGVDNERANAIVIYGAENFGLSSLHQLRGRVGRRGQKSYCFLVTDCPTEKQKERLAVFKNTTDGFKIADYDLASRGAGDAYGVRQHGKSFFSNDASGSFEDIKRAKEIADEISLDSLDEERFAMITKERSPFLDKIVLN